MKREHFAFIIGYQGDTALVDGRMLRKFGKLTCRELVDRGLYKNALRSSLHSQNQEELDYLLDAYREKSGGNWDSVDTLKRLFGVYEPGTHGYRVKILR